MLQLVAVKSFYSIEHVYGGISTTPSRLFDWQIALKVFSINIFIDDLYFFMQFLSAVIFIKMISLFTTQISDLTLNPQYFNLFYLNPLHLWQIM